ncbi:hypothetical protein Cfor_07429 [Coptotermes formosanus]|uniref:VWFC domain-containing protein n=1 Tax=Coptotermes formosanus TaxID=36987 RepID=A0A6L2PPR4_COPFO|nr:hypothetical protein Cfor_07429 [Coptotermes formosanus]
MTTTAVGTTVTSPLTASSQHLTEVTQVTSSRSTVTTPAVQTPVPTSCYVMGTEYKIGEVLPRDTGTCLECVCDNEARVTCSPKDCATHDDYRSSSSLDMFDVDTF